MATYISPNEITCEVGIPLRLDLGALARASVAAGNPFLYGGLGDNINWQVLDAVTEIELWENLNVEVDNDDLVLTARNTDVENITLTFWDFTAPENIIQLNIAVVMARRRAAGGIAPVPPSPELGEPLEVDPPPAVGVLRMADMNVWGVGDRIALPTAVSPFFEDDPPAPVVDEHDLSPAVRVVTGQNTLEAIRLVARGSTGTAVSFAPYAFRVTPVPPLLPEYDPAVAGANLTADNMYCAPGAQITILPASILDAIPAQYKEDLALGAMTFEVLQGGGAPCVVVTGAGNTYPRLVLGTTTADMPSRNTTITVAIKDTATLTTRYGLRFYFKVLRTDGTDPQNIPEPFVGVPRSDTGPGTSPIPSERPGLPINFRRTAFTSTSVTYAWNAVTGATGYDIYLVESDFAAEVADPVRSTAPTFSVGEVTSTQRTGLTPQRRYRAWCRAKNSAGISGWVGPVSLDTPRMTTTAPVVPRDFSGTAVSDTEILYTYSHTDGRAVGYDLFFSTSNTAPTPQTAPTATIRGRITGQIRRTGLTASTTYYAWLRAVGEGSAGNSAWVAAEPVTTLAPQPVPAVPQNFRRFTSTATTITYVWSTIPGLTYELYLAEDATAPTSSTTPTATGLRGGTVVRTRLTEGQEYHAYLRARNSAGASDWTDAVITTAEAPAVLPGGNAPNLPPGETALYRNAVYPPPLRQAAWVRRRYEGQLPERLPQETIAVLSGKD